LELVCGSKFTEAAPDMKRQWTDRVVRRNVLTQVAKYARRVVGLDVAKDYERLCNAVHPSFGTTLMYSTLPMRHVNGTHADRLWSATPTRIVSVDSSSGPGQMETILARTAITTLVNALSLSQGRSQTGGRHLSYNQGSRCVYTASLPRLSSGEGERFLPAAKGSDFSCR
jgi:hypothetical protein